MTRWPFLRFSAGSWARRASPCIHAEESLISFSMPVRTGILDFVRKTFSFTSTPFFWGATQTPMVQGLNFSKAVFFFSPFFLGDRRDQQ